MKQDKKNYIMRKEEGFSLLEVLVALTVLAVGLLMLAMFQITAIQANTTGFKISSAVALGEEAIEQLKMLDPTSNAALTAGNHISSTDAAIIPDATRNGIVYTRSYTVVDNGKTRTIALDVKWTDKTNHTVTMTTIVKE